jgi:serine/threonine protein kinase/tetratricopeptide (TPR) repeat protein
MEPQHASIESVFHSARRLSNFTERDRYLDQACAGDPALRARVEKLLAADLKAGSFLEASSTAETQEAPHRSHTTQTAGVVPATDSLLERPGTVIGRYKLLQQIGEGGFGVVYMAEQREPVQRKVALKVIKLGMDTRQVIARFEAERQALALMDHAHIARVFDGGATESGRPYFVMELVRGDPITEYADRHQMTIAQRLSLFVEVCQAVQHAHQKGVIHRDLKPSNVLVSTQDGRPHAKVIDFGIAKATAAKLTQKTVFTEHKQFIGTPEYMSPEQAQGSLDIDTRTDVYSLGVLLYELLTGTTPFDPKSLRGAAYTEIERIIREVDPPKPSTRVSGAPSRRQDEESATPSLVLVAAHRRTEPKKLGSVIRGDLDWIVMKALEKDRARRYETANGLAADILRHLAREPVIAAPPSASYRLRKFARRNRRAATGGVVVAGVLLAATAVSVWFGLRETAARAAERAQRQLAEKRADETQRVADFQGRMLSEIDAEAMGRGIKDRLREQVRAALERQYLGEYPNRRPRTPEELDAELAAYDARAGVALAVDVSRRVMDEFVLRHAAEAAQKEFSAQPLVHAQISDSIGVAYQSLGLYDAAEPHLRAALQLRRQELGSEHELVAVSLSKLGELSWIKHDYSAADSLFSEALAVRRKLFGEEHADVASSMADMAKVHRIRSNHPAAEKLYRDALAMFKRTRGDEHMDVAAGLNNLGMLLNEKEDYAAAEPLFREALAMLRKLGGEDDPGVMTVRNNLGRVLQRKGDYAAAELTLRETLACRRRLLGDEHPDVAATLNDLAGTLMEKGDLDGAESLSRESLEIYRKVLGDASPEAVSGLQDLGAVLRRKGDLEAAEPLFREALALERKVFGDESSQVANTMNSLGVLLEAKKDYAAAEPLFRQSLAIRRKTPGRQQEAIGNSLHNLANLLRAQGEYAAAEPLYREAIAKYRQVLGDAHPKTLYPKIGLAETLAELHRYSDGETWLLDVVKKCELDPNQRRLHWRTIAKTAVLLYENWDSAEPGNGYGEKAAEWRAQSPPENEKDAVSDGIMTIRHSSGANGQ